MLNLGSNWRERLYDELKQPPPVVLVPPNDFTIVQNRLLEHLRASGLSADDLGCEHYLEGVRREILNFVGFLEGVQREIRNFVGILRRDLEPDLARRLLRAAQRAAPCLATSAGRRVEPEELTGPAYENICRMLLKDPERYPLEMDADYLDSVLFNFCFNAGRTLFKADRRFQGRAVSLEQMENEPHQVHCEAPPSRLEQREVQVAFDGWFADALQSCGSDQNRTILQLMCKGCSRTAIAKELGISPEAVSAALMRIKPRLRKLPHPLN